MSPSPVRHRPNVLVIIMDDLTYGDLSCHGNPHTHTHRLDRLREQSSRWERYCTGFLCTPARSMLMTGRYAYRTRAIDTYCGRSLMDPDEITLAQVLRDAGYATCISGKWHLGDNYPLRAMDQGFDEALVHNGGGLCQPANFGHDDYFNPDLMHNGRLTPTQGYCTDIFAEHCMRFIQQHREEPWFCYLATNAPHTPIIVDEKWSQPFKDKGLGDKLAGMYGMIQNIDWNIGRVLDHLDKLGLTDDTLVIYTSDHGAQGGAIEPGGFRYNSDLRGGKGTPYDGGVKTPCFWRWPGKIQAGQTMDRVSGPFDFLPTLAAACGAKVPDDRAIDGINYLPAMTGEKALASYPDRTVVIQWHRGDVPVRYRNAAVVGQRYKLVLPEDQTKPPELYDWTNDPGEQHDLADQHPDIVAAMKQFYDRWYDDVSLTRGEGNYDPPDIFLTTPHENPTVLTRNDWRVHGEDGWDDSHFGHWCVYVPESKPCKVELRFTGFDQPGKVTLMLQDQTWHAHLPAGANQVSLNDVKLPQGSGRLEAWADLPDRRVPAKFIFVIQ